MKTVFCIIVTITLGLWVGPVCAQNIDPYSDGATYAYGENTGWFNFKPSQGSGVTVQEGAVLDYLWQENIGWINLSPSSYGGVSCDSNWQLSGYAWGENVGWINFNPVVADNPTHYGVTLDSDGRFSGWAWGENIGWIKFDSVQSWNVRACVVTLDDLVNFASHWLQSGAVPANLDMSGNVDMEDFALFASYWKDFCPGEWELK